MRVYLHKHIQVAANSVYLKGIENQSVSWNKFNPWSLKIANIVCSTKVAFRKYQSKLDLKYQMCSSTIRLKTEYNLLTLLVSRLKSFYM